MKKCYLFLVLGMFFPQYLYAYNIATEFQHPVASDSKFYTTVTDEGWIVAQDYQDCREKMVPSGISPCRHLGEDWNYRINGRYENEGREIHAIANGYIVISGVKQGFAGYIIMKHYLSDGSYVLSIYGHLQTANLPSADTYFNKGDYLASTATRSEMEKWTTFGPHLHFEIRKEKSITGFADTFLNDGYADDSNNKYYYDPTDVVTIDMSTYLPVNADESTDKGFVESHMGNCIAGYGATANSPSTFEDYLVNLRFINNCSTDVTIQDVAISFHDITTGNCVKKCYRKGSGYDLTPGESDSIGDQACNVDPDTDTDPCSNTPLVHGEYLLVYKVKYGDKWYHVREKTVEIKPETKHANITPIISLLLNTPKSQTVPSVATGFVKGLPADTSFYFDDRTDMTTNIHTQWSLNQFNPDRGYFYAYNFDSSSEVAHSTQITNVCEISDASAYTYEAWSVGPVDEGDFILFHNKVTGFYGAFRVDNIYGSWQAPLLDLTWYLQEDGSSSFNKCSSN